jgi:hypothetical protein
LDASEESQAAGEVAAAPRAISADPLPIGGRKQLRVATVDQPHANSLSVGGQKHTEGTAQHTEDGTDDRGTLQCCGSGAPSSDSPSAAEAEPSLIDGVGVVNWLGCCCLRVLFIQLQICFHSLLTSALLVRASSVSDGHCAASSSSSVQHSLLLYDDGSVAM